MLKKVLIGAAGVTGAIVGEKLLLIGGTLALFKKAANDMMDKSDKRMRDSKQRWDEESAHSHARFFSDFDKTRKDMKRDSDNFFRDDISQRLKK